MPIHVKKIKINLTADTPTKLTAESLQQQLRSLGLNCVDTFLPQLTSHIGEVKAQLPTGRVQTFGIYEPKKSEANQLPHRLTYKSEFQAEQVAESGYVGEVVYDGLQVSSQGNWTPNETAAGYMAQLHYIQQPEHFDYLCEYQSDFTGKKEEPPPYTGMYETVDAIKELFVLVGSNASSMLVKGLDKDALESVLSNIIPPLNDTQAKDYDYTDSRVIYLVDNYHEDSCDGIGVLTINWRLQIKDYKNRTSKDSIKHKTTLTIRVRSVVYSDLAVLNADHLFIESHLKDKLFKVFSLQRIPILSKVKIFTVLPPANRDTLLQSLPKIAKEGFVEVIVLHSPNLEQIGSLDNTDSDATSTYSVSLTNGFTFATSQSFSVEHSFEASAEIIKASVTVGFQLSFTEEWSQSRTETLEISVPAGKKSFLYQGYMLSAILRYDPATDTYKYVEKGKLKANVVKTTSIPLINTADS